MNSYPIYTSKHRSRKYHANLLLIKSQEKSHYVVIRSLSKLLKGRDAGNGNEVYICKYCLCAFTSEILLDKHEVNCSEHPSQKVVYPTLGENILRFKNFGNTLEMPFCIYADFESLFVPNGESKESNKHEPSGVAVLTVSAFPEYNTEQIFVYSGPETMEKFFEHLEEEKQRINSILSENFPMIPLTVVEQGEYESAKTCKNCGTEFDDGAFSKVYHHLHSNGQYLFPACNRCNLSLKYKQSSRKSKNKPASFEIPVVFHNLSNYDPHLILQHMPKIDRKDKASCIATSSERLITFSYRGLKFVDSCNFIKASLATLCQNLKNAGIENFIHTKRHFDTDEKFNLMIMKEVFPYEYMDSFDRFTKTQLPGNDAFFSSLTNSGISDQEYEHAKTVWNIFECETLQDFHDVYVKSDVLILADIFEALFKLSLKDYGLDPKRYLTLPSYSWDAMLRETSVNIELLCDPAAVLMIESAIRGGVSVITNRYARSNNPFVPDYDVTQPTSYVSYFDCTNLYGTSMIEQLPLCDFRFLDNDEIRSFDVMSLDPQGNTGFFVECDLEYPPELHDQHNDLPLCPSHLEITREILSDVTIQLGEKHGQKFKPQRKLAPTLLDKTKYVCHTSNLQFYIQHGIRLKRIHRILSFTQTDWLKCYIDFNTEKRKNSRNSFESDLYKLMSNAARIFS